MHRKYVLTKKIFISILTVTIVFLTSIATTFAWVGVLSNSTFESVDISIRSSELLEYGVEVSTSGLPGTFSDEIKFGEIKKQILINCGIEESQLQTQEQVDNKFSRLVLDQCTTLPVMSGDKMKSFGAFKDVHGNPTKLYFKFDLYISANRFYGDGPSDYLLDVYLNDNILTGTIKKRTLFNAFDYPDSFVNPLSGSTLLEDGVTAINGGSVIETTMVDSSSAARIGFEKYEVVDKYHPEQYSSSTPVSAVIYSGDKYDYPVYYTDSNTYSFGGILPNELNLAIGYYNSTEYMYEYHGKPIMDMAQDIMDIRGVGSANADRIINFENNQLINSNDPNEQIGLDKMMKVTCYFWFEGWDADCYSVINASPVKINIEMSTSNELLNKN